MVSLDRSISNSLSDQHPFGTNNDCQLHVRKVGCVGRKSKWPLYKFNGRLMRSVALSNHNKVLLTSKAPWSGLQSSKMTTWDCGKSKRGYDPRAGQANTSAALRRAHQRLAVQKGGGQEQGNNVYHVKNAWQELGIVGPHSYRLIDLDGTKA